MLTGESINFWLYYCVLHNYTLSQNNDARNIIKKWFKKRKKYIKIIEKEKEEKCTNKRLEILSKDIVC